MKTKKRKKESKRNGNTVKHEQIRTELEDVGSEAHTKGIKLNN